MMDTREVVAGRILEALVDAGAAGELVRLDSTWEQLGADPIVVLRAVEGRYGVFTGSGEVAALHTVGEAVDFVVGRVAALNRQGALR
jgi:hypothetical protein